VSFRRQFPSLRSCLLHSSLTGLVPRVSSLSVTKSLQNIEKTRLSTIFLAFLCLFAGIGFKFRPQNKIFNIESPNFLIFFFFLKLRGTGGQKAFLPFLLSRRKAGESQ